MHNCNCGASTRKKTICSNCIHSIKDKLRKSEQFKSSSYFDVRHEYASSCSNSQISNNMSTQTTFKSTTSVNLQYPKKKVDIYKEICTQTSKTVIAISELETDRFSPDSLSPKHDFPVLDEAGDSVVRDFGSLSVVDLDYVPFQRKSKLTHCLAQCQAESKDFQTGDALTRVYLSKNKDKISSSPGWIAEYYIQDSLKSQSFLESPPKDNSPELLKTTITRFKVNKVKAKSSEESGNPSTEKCRRNLSFMSPTISSESKDQSLEIETIQKLISPSRKGRSLSPYNGMVRDVPNGSDNSLLMKKVPYIDSSNANLENKALTAEEQLVLNLKESCEDITSTLETGTSTTSTEYALSQAISKLKDKDWNTALRGLAEVVEILKVLDGEIVHPHMTVINQRLIELIRSPRSHVCRTACQAIGHLFELIKDTRRPEFDILVDTLLCKTADSNKFIRHDANLALDCMVTHIPTFHAIRTLCSKGPDHKNALVRTATARLLVCAIVIAGSSSILHPHNNEYTRRRIIVNMVKFLDDRCLEIRRYGERIYRILYKDRIFEIYLRRYLESDKIKKIKLCMKQINGQKI